MRLLDLTACVSKIMFVNGAVRKTFRFDAVQFNTSVTDKFTQYVYVSKLRFEVSRKDFIYIPKL